MVTDIITGADRLLEIVNNKGELSLTSAAEQLGLPKETVGAWCDTLEQEGLLITNYTLRDRHIITADMDKATNHNIKNIKRQLKSIVNTQKGLTKEQFLKRKEKEIDQKLSALHDQLKELRNCETKKNRANERIKLLKQHEARLNELEKKLNEKGEVLAKEQAIVAKQLINLSAKEVRFARASKQLRNKEKSVRAAEERFAEGLKAIDQQLLNLTKHKQTVDKKRVQTNKDEEKLWNLVSNLGKK